MGNTFKVLLPVLLILAAIGIMSNMGLFFSSIGVAVVIVAVFYLGYRFFLSKRYGTSMFSKTKDGPTRAQLKKAQRTSTVKRKGPTPPTKTSKQAELNKKGVKRVPKRRSPPHLTVIEGKATKPKKKKKA